MSIILLGLHLEHLGCRMVSKILKNYTNNISLKNNENLFIVNGEGTIHHNSNGAYKKLGLFKENPSTLNHKTYLINTVYEEITDDKLIDIIKNNIDYITVREWCSYNNIIKHRSYVQIYLDVTYFYNNLYKIYTINDKKDNIEIINIQPNSFKKYDTNNLIKILQYENQNYKIINYGCCNINNFDEYKHKIENTDICISGRQHDFYLNSIMSIITIVIVGNTDKVKGIIDYAGVNIPLFTHKNIIEYFKYNTIQDFYNTYYYEYSKLFKFMKNCTKLNIENIPHIKPIYAKLRDYRIINIEISKLNILFKQQLNDGIKKSILKNRMLDKPLIILKINKNNYKVIIKSDLKIPRPFPINIFKDNEELYFIKLGNQHIIILKELHYTHCDCIIFNNYTEYITSEFNYKKPTNPIDMYILNNWS